MSPPETRNDRGYKWDTCLECGADITMVGRTSRLRVHGPRNARCPGSGKIGQYVNHQIQERKGD